MEISPPYHLLWPQTFQELKVLVEHPDFGHLPIHYNRLIADHEYYMSLQQSGNRKALMFSLKQEIREAQQTYDGYYYAILPCKFPYRRICRGLAEHLLIWGNFPIEVAREILETNYDEFACYENPSHRKSVPELGHYHFFIPQPTLEFSTYECKAVYSVLKDYLAQNGEYAEGIASAVHKMQLLDQA